MPARTDSIGGRLSGISSLVAFAMANRIQRSYNVQERTTWAVNLFNLLYAVFRTDTQISPELNKLLEDFIYLRKNYSDVLDFENWAINERNEFNQYLDHIELRLYQIVKDSKIIDSAGLREMVVPE